MSTTSAGHLEDLVIGLGADDAGSADVIRRFESNVFAGTTTAQGHADDYSRAIIRAHELTMAVATPLQKFNIQLDELDDLLRLGAISQETYNKTFDKYQKELDTTTPKVNKFTAALTRLEGAANLGYKLSFAVTTPLSILGGVALKTASDAEETVNKFNVIFGPVATRANDIVKDLDKNYGLTASSATKMLSNTGDLLKGFGFAADGALDLAETTQKLAVDVASFSNVEGGAVRVSEALTKAMLGEREMLKEMGIAILEEDVKLRVAQLTKEGHVFTTERQAKAYATLDLAMEQSAHRLGDFAATEGSFANQTRMLTDDFWELVELFGKELIPVALTLTRDVFRPLIGYFKDLSPETKQIAVGFMAIAAATGPILVTVSQVAGGINTLISLGPGIKSFAGNFSGMASGANLARLGVYALGTYLAYEGLKSLTGYNAAVADLNEALTQLGATNNLIVQRRNAGKEKQLEAAKEVSTERGRIEALKALRAIEVQEAQDYNNTVQAMTKMEGGRGHRSKSNGAETKEVMKQATADWQAAKERIMRIDAEIEAVKANGAKALSEAQQEMVAGYATEATNTVSALFGDMKRVAMGGPNSEEKELVRGAVSEVYGVIGEAVGNRVKDPRFSKWIDNMFDGAAESLGVISETVIDLKAFTAQSWDIEFKAKGLEKLSADGIDALAMWQEQAYKTAEQIQAGQNAPSDVAAGAALAGGAMVGGGLFGLVGGVAANVGANAAVPPGQQERDERDRRKEQALVKLADKQPIVFEVAGPQ